MGGRVHTESSTTRNASSTGVGRWKILRRVDGRMIPIMATKVSATRRPLLNGLQPGLACS
jgi:hypothetical protein